MYQFFFLVKFFWQWNVFLIKIFFCQIPRYSLPLPPQHLHSVPNQPKNQSQSSGYLLAMNNAAKQFFVFSVKFTFTEFCGFEPQLVKYT